MDIGTNSVRVVLQASSYSSLFDSPFADAPTRLMCRDLLAAVVTAGDDLETSFVAAEVLIRNHAEGWHELPKHRLAEIYSAALNSDFAGSANPWGLPGQVGLLGQRLVMLGVDALPALAPLLTVERRVRYVGGDDVEVTRANQAGLRVADVAGFYYGLIAFDLFDVTESVAKRDARLNAMVTGAAEREQRS